MTNDANEPSFSPKRHAPETLRLKAITPSVTVGDLDASIEWYSRVVGFHVAETMERDGERIGAELVAGLTRLILFQDDWAKGRDRAKGEGFRLYLQTSQEVDGVAAAIRERGGTLTSEPADRPWGARAFDLVDPDGFRLTITS